MLFSIVSLTKETLFGLLFQRGCKIQSHHGVEGLVGGALGSRVRTGGNGAAPEPRGPALRDVLPLAGLHLVKVSQQHWLSCVDTVLGTSSDPVSVVAWISSIHWSNLDCWVPTWIALQHLAAAPVHSGPS